MTSHTHTDACYDLATDVLICGQSTPHDRYQTRSILDIALQVHMTTTGSYERSENDQKADIHFLRMRLQTWEKNLLAKSVSFDEAVRNLVRIAVQEAEGTLL